ncbi:uncharacterized protein RHOBADRAFT_55282 [Rhodotorula graminis WP1]|uniref:F-box domain-containing protein n=1 Tax=Rhodotorula graminis (strain WP1) TaxID=578459 RepID=A0A0P9EV89_RHOGW|nr:uncharacterized protein RHOBADRAFT_55282 [Rhodotorula graminis WP1]KPV73042.1 hypothetical protein RHOBADRAFT_55282 [Rhodotorula graminis WP1]
MAAPTLPVELILQTILLSLDSAPTTPRPLSDPPSSASAGSTTPRVDEEDRRAAATVSPSRTSLVRLYTLTSRTFRSLSQPLLFRHPVLPTPTSLRTFIAAVENEEDGGRLGEAVRSLTVGPASATSCGARLGASAWSCASVDLGRLARACGNVRELTLRGVERMRLDDLVEMRHLRALTIEGSSLASTRDRPLVPALPALPVTNLALINCRPSPSSLNSAIFPSVKALHLVVPGASRAAPDELVDFLRGVAPQLRSLSVHDQAAHDPATSLSLVHPDIIETIYDAFPSMTSLVHLDVVNAIPTHALSLLPLSTLASLRTISLSLDGVLASGAARKKLRWAPLADSLLHDALAALRILLLPPEALFPYKGVNADDLATLSSWVRALQRSKALERVVLPSRASEDGLGEMVRELRGELKRWDRRVELVDAGVEVDLDVEGRSGRGGFWSEVRRREREEREASGAGEGSL